MNDNERSLLRAIVEKRHKDAEQIARIILNGITSQRDRQFKENLLRKMDAQPKDLISLPVNLQELLVAENVDHFPTERFILRNSEKFVVERILATYRASSRLLELGIPYLSSAVFYGASGTGKTELARYIAYRAGLPFIYVRFSSLVSSYLGSTQSNVGKVFQYAKSSPCVLCFDEIDAVGLKRGDRNDVSEMSRVVIALMQELDQIQNTAIIIGTTNRFDRLDPALVRRFHIQHEVLPLDWYDADKLIQRFFRYVNIPCPGFSTVLHQETVEAKQLMSLSYPASEVVSACTDYIVDYIIQHEAEEEIKTMGL